MNNRIEITYTIRRAKSQPIRTGNPLLDREVQKAVDKEVDNLVKQLLRRSFR